MRETRSVAAIAVVALALAAAGGLAGCTEAKAEPLEVTYYYLPG